MELSRNYGKYSIFLQKKKKKNSVEHESLSMSQENITTENMLNMVEKKMLANSRE